MKVINGVYVFDSSQPEPGDGERLLDAVRNLDIGAMQEHGRQMSEKINDAVSLQMAHAEIRRCQTLVAYLVRRMGGSVFIRRSEQEAIALDAADPDFKMPIEIEEATDAPLNGIYIRSQT